MNAPPQLQSIVEEAAAAGQFSGVYYGSNHVTPFATAGAQYAVGSASLQINAQQHPTTGPMFSPQQQSIVYLSTGGGGGGNLLAPQQQQQAPQISQNSFSVGSVSSIGSSLEFEDEQPDSYQDSNSDRLSHMSIKERRQCKLDQLDRSLSLSLLT